MAHWRVGGVGNRPPLLAFDRPAVGKRRIICIEEDIGEVPDDEEYPLDRQIKRRRESFTLDVHFYTEAVVPLQPETANLPDFWSVSARLKPNPTAGVGIERTASGLSISDDPTDHRSASTELLEDAAAAQRVREHMTTFKRRNPDSKHERVLRNIISPKSAAATYPLDNEALESIFLAANEIFFHGRLSQRVTWDWSHSSSPHYDSSVIGTTALRHASKRGFETLIVLSSPILQDRKYSRRLLISTFLHELIHSYLFICCGFRARHCGGHTPGFHTIAGLVDAWAGPDSFLYLSKMEADLSCFRAENSNADLDPGFDPYGGETPVERERSPLGDSQKENVYPCSGAMEHQHSCHDFHDHQPPDGGYSDYAHQSRATPDRVAYFEEDYNSYDDQQWPDDRAARPAPHRHRPYQVPYFDDEEPQEFGLPYV
ncbi:hypothetical protein CONLIGDRAFT_512081 [Coniochaeta ligniaria NRRL 30616]|uniref:SprT-like domain-containing protein n=1 Tax=Coniochaeta ligniaria NRRL 30616 TaxID=1408157 RepID=A0A1J7IF60_9PEZI|nr:hypothetical protein CONLIGDRAFT_512081 [Coniochaeta ligniaria NRRL 30616]